MTAQVPSLPDAGFLKLAKLLRQHDLVSALEKTAEVSGALGRKEDEILQTFYKLASRSPSWGDVSASVQELAALTVTEAGMELLKVADIAVDPDHHAESLSKLASIGLVNAKLRQALSDPEIPDSWRAEVIKLGQENNFHCIEVLKDLALEKKAGFFGNAAAGVKNFFGGGGPAGGAMQAGINRAMPATPKPAMAALGRQGTPALPKPPPAPSQLNSVQPTSTVRPNGMNIDQNKVKQFKFGQ